MELEVRRHLWPYLLGVYAPEDDADTRQAINEELREGFEALIAKLRVRGSGGRAPGGQGGGGVRQGRGRACLSYSSCN